MLCTGLSSPVAAAVNGASASASRLPAPGLLGQYSILPLVSALDHYLGLSSSEGGALLLWSFRG